MTSKENEIFQSLISGGIIGAALGFLLSKNKERGTSLGALAGAAILATYEANKAAHLSSIPVYIEENRKLYSIDADGHKSFVKDIPKPTEKLAKKFKLV